MVFYDITSVQKCCDESRIVSSISIEQNSKQKSFKDPKYDVPVEQLQSRIENIMIDNQELKNDDIFLSASSVSNQNKAIELLYMPVKQR